MMKEDKVVFNENKVLVEKIITENCANLNPKDAK